MVCQSCGEQVTARATEQVADTDVLATVNGKQVTKSDVRVTASIVGLSVAFLLWISGERD